MAGKLMGDATSCYLHLGDPSDALYSLTVLSDYV